LAELLRALGAKGMFANWYDICECRR